MHDDNQASPQAPAPGPVPDAGAASPAEASAGAVAAVPAPFGLVPETAGFEPPAFDAERWMRTNRALTTWFVILATFGIGGLLLKQQELAALASIAGLFVTAQAADIDRQWRMLYLVLSWVVPAAGVSAFVAIGMMLRSTSLPEPWLSLLVGLCFGGAAASAMTFFRPFSHALASWMFRTRQTSHTLRLTARIVFLSVLFALPGWFAIRKVFPTLGDEVGSLVDSASLGTGLVGYVLLAFAAVGFLLRRNWREALQRLGIGPVSASRALVIPLGVIGLYVLNGTADWLQKTYLHSLWIDDQQMSEAIGSGLGTAGTIVLGLSAGIGEEITMRGALQPRLGLIGTSLLFASLHVQYSWYGMGVIFLLGLVLGTIRKRTNTTVVMAIHALYDMAAVFTATAQK